MTTPRLRMFAGPNGSGKSTLNKLLAPELMGVYLNPDEIERLITQQGFLDLSAYRVTTTAEVVLPFFAASQFLRDANQGANVGLLTFATNRLDFTGVAMNSYLASVLVDFLRQQLLQRKESFTIETVMSHPSKVELLAQAQALGYRTYLYYIATDDPEINVSRVRNRVGRGGHAVPEHLIRSRYHRSLGLLRAAISHTNRAYIFDNSGENRQHTWIAEITGGTTLETKTDRLPAWFQRAVLATGDVGVPERVTQKRVVALFRDELGYDHLGDWTDRAGNSHVEEALLTANLIKRGYTTAQITKAIHVLRTEAGNPNRNLYDNNQQVYGRLRYGVPVKTEVGKPTETVALIDWENPAANDFAVAEEVTLRGNHERRPDLVLYVNGIALGVIELKNSRVSISDGIRQNLSNQMPEFNAWFFSTVQLVFAGNDSEGLRYGTIGTSEKEFLQWKEDESDNRRFKLDKYLLLMCQKARLLELIHDFVLFDGGKKKLPRVHQYVGIKLAQERVRAGKGGIIWHTQGSGKSIVMVLLAKWILENRSNARVVIVTDRDELDKQIAGVFAGTATPIVRASSGRDLIAQLGKAEKRLVCSLIHKFGRKDVEDFEAFIQDLANQPKVTVGELFVFVDECHRTQSGKLHRTMKALMPDAVFIGFTGTPLLKEDRKTSHEVFGDYIHTYKFDEGVVDGVVLDLIYEARDIAQRLASEDRIDAWFDAKTKGLNRWQKAALREQWGTMQQVLSSRSRMERVVEDIVFDFGVKPRLNNHRGNAILVAASIYEACKYYELFQKTVFKGQCAVVTSHNPHAQTVTLEETGANTQTDKQFIRDTYLNLLTGVDARAGKTATETYEDEAKKRFREQPAAMRLLIVVDKLLTGFDAPSCTYLYIDKTMRDHGLFQAICRTNRLDGEDKEFGYIVDYKDLFSNLVNEDGTGALQVYTSELDQSAGGTDAQVLLQERLSKGRERLDDAFEAVAFICEPVASPKSELEHIHYFCGNSEIPADLAEREPQRAALYKATAALMRAYANIADDLSVAGYSAGEIVRIKRDLERSLNLRATIRRASGETIDLKAYEADMRHLIDTYIEADQPRKISPFDDQPLLEMIVQSGITAAVDHLPEGIKGDPDAVAETIANNVRSTIIKEHLNDPAFYDRMSHLLREIIADLRAKRIDYAQYLARIAALAKQVHSGQADDLPSALRGSPALRALYNNLPPVVSPTKPTDPPRSAETGPGYEAGEDPRIALAVRIDETVRRVRPDDWREHTPRENEIKRALLPLLNQDAQEVERIFLIIKQQSDY